MAITLTDDQVAALATACKFSDEAKTALSDDIEQAGNAALAELERVGVSDSVLESLDEWPLAWNAVIFYVRYYLNAENRGDQWYTAFYRLCRSLPLSENYRDDSEEA